MYFPPEKNAYIPLNFQNIVLFFPVTSEVFVHFPSGNYQRHRGSFIHLGVVQIEPPLFGVCGKVNAGLNLSNPVLSGAFGPQQR